MTPVVTVTVSAGDVARAMEASIALLDRNMHDALDAGAILIADRAKELAGQRITPRTGSYQRSIMPGKVTGRFSAGAAGVRIQAGAGGVFYALFIEEGTRAHEIRAKPNRPNAHLRWVGSAGDFVFARSVRHPGTRAQHVMRDAAEGAMPELAELIADAARAAFAEAGL